MDLRTFGSVVAPIEDTIEWEGNEWPVAFSLLAGAEQDRVVEEAAQGHPDGRDLREVMCRLARAVHSVAGEVVTWDLPRRKLWVFGDGTKANPGWLEPFVWQMAAAYDRARDKVVTEAQKVANDPFSPVSREDGSGAACETPATSPTGT